MLRTVKTENGFVKGLPAADPRISSFKGIPFAAVPVGELRWKAPQPAEDWEGVRECFQFSPISMQNIPGLDLDNIYTREWNVDPEISMSEDCLYLNVWTPAKSEEDSYPVYVWFFGGALQYGNTAEMEFDGERLARRGIVVVTVNYRINVFGFLTHPELTKENPDAPANFGHLDQQYALQWVRRNISAFGGNPEQITIGGQSAGGGSVMTQINCEKSRGLFQRAIVASGIFADPFYDSLFPTLSLTEAEKKGEEFFAFLGVKSLEEARRLPADYIRDKNQEGNFFWGTVIDNCFQQENYMQALQNGSFPDIPLLLGYTTNEFQIPVPEEQRGEWDRDVINAVELAEHTALVKMEENGKKCPWYLYEFGAEIPGWDEPGTFHSSDLWFFFETLAKCWRPFCGKHYDLARQMCNYWAYFIKEGNPNGIDQDGSEMEKWIAYTKEHTLCMCFEDKPKLQRRKPKKLLKQLIDER